MTEPRWDLIHDAVITDDDPALEPREHHATTCDLLVGRGWRVCSCGFSDEQEVDGAGLDCG